MSIAPSIKAFLAHGFTKEQALKARAIIKGLTPPEVYESVSKWISQCYHLPMLHEQKMEALNEILEGYGVEAIETATYVAARYVNLGDTYTPTILRTSKGHYRLQSWGDFVERSRVAIP